MKKTKERKLKWSLVLLLFVSSGCIYAQQAMVMSGGFAQSATGSISYSVGEVAYQSYESGTGKVTEGVQQPYEIFALATNENDLNKSKTVYPNPVKDFLTVDFNAKKLNNARYQFFDATGRIIKSGNLTNMKNEINTSALSPGMYLLSILENEKTIKTFKIIKK